MSFASRLLFLFEAESLASRLQKCRHQVNSLFGKVAFR